MKHLNLIRDNKIKTRYLAWKIITKSKKNNKKITDVSKKCISELNFTSQELNFTTNLINGTVRMKGRLDWELSKVADKYYILKNQIKVILRLGLYQIRFMNSVPNYAAVNTSVDLCKTINSNYTSFINAVLRNVININFTEPKITDVSEFSNYISHPKWLIEKWNKVWNNKEINDLSRWNNSIPQIWFRINTILSNNNEVVNFLKDSNINYRIFKHDNNFFTTDQSSHLLNSDLFKKGCFTVQNPSAGLVCHLLEPKEDDFIIDCCSAPGGKTSYLSQLMNNKGKILSIDSNDFRINTLNETINRLNLKNVTVKNKNLTKNSLPKTSKILLDLPCSGTGVLNKKVDIKWRINYNNIIKMQSIQKAILNNISKYLNKNGIIVYSTCSLEKEENMDIINSFLDKNKNFSINRLNDILPKTYIKDRTYMPFPPLHKIDGGFACILKKNDE